MMEVTSDEAVLLEGMEGTQYITIQRTDGEGLSINGELLSEGMVVDIINAGVSNEYTNTQFYESDDLLPHELTEEDRKLAAALVAVQLQQQQKHQQNNQNQTHNDGTSLPDVSSLTNLSPVNTYAIQAIPPEPSSSSSSSSTSSTVYSSLQSTFKRINHPLKHEFINVKSEYDLDISNDDDNNLPNCGPRRSLPHKKRIAKKLKQQTNKKQQIVILNNNDGKKKQNVVQLDNQTTSDSQHSSQSFKCELCNSKFGGQLQFFEHLKTHYEPVKQESRVIQSANITISVPQNVQNLDNTIVEEFSEPEDLMEGIRGVVEETGAHIDEETESNPLDDVNDNTSLWGINDVSELSNNELCTTGNHQENETTRGGKKKKNTKAKKNQFTEMTCPQCDRTFNHKNSLVYHMRSHSGERPHQCEVCGKSFFAASALKVHKRLHSGDKPYKCEDCGRHFRQWGDLKYHSMSIHSEQRQFQCEYCGKDFARKYSLIVHRRIHTGEKNYRCEYCNKTFRASSYLQNHRRIHTGEKPHPCTICGKPFRVRSDMKRHMHTHTRGRNERPGNNTPASVKTINENENENENGNGNGNENENENVNVNINANANVNVNDNDNDNDNDNEKNIQQSRTLIQDLVQELKLESPNNNVEIVSPEDNAETILPHEGNSGIDYNVTTVAESNTDRDPLEAIDRTSDSLQYFFM